VFDTLKMRAGLTPLSTPRSPNEKLLSSIESNALKCYVLVQARSLNLLPTSSSQAWIRKFTVQAFFSLRVRLTQTARHRCEPTSGALPYCFGRPI